MKAADYRQMHSRMSARSKWALALEAPGNVFGSWAAGWNCCSPRLTELSFGLCSRFSPITGASPSVPRPASYGRITPS